MVYLVHLVCVVCMVPQWVTLVHTNIHHGRLSATQTLTHPQATMHIGTRRIIMRHNNSLIFNSSALFASCCWQHVISTRLDSPDAMGCGVYGSQLTLRSTPVVTRLLILCFCC